MELDYIRRERREQDFSERLAETGWYHSMELPGGRIIRGYLTIEDLRSRYESFGLPPDLSGKRVLDIGTWDGWFAFEAERHGAEVVALDLVEQKNFLFAHKELKSRVRYVLADVYDLPRLGLGRFDYTLFLGVLYHLRHPLLALDIVCGITNESAIIDSFILAGEDQSHIASPIPWMEFYETDELGRNLDNWFGPTLDCLKALCRSAGFARVELKDIRNRHATLVCHRRWDSPPASPHISAPTLSAALHGGNFGINFEEGRLEEFLTCWFSTEQLDISRDDLCPEVAGFGVPALTLRKDPSGNPHFSCRLPPGLDAGWYDVRLRTSKSGFSSSHKIAVGIPPGGAPTIRAACDGLLWSENHVVRDAGPGYLTLWVSGLADNCDKDNVRIYVDDHRLPVEYISQPQDGVWQINTTLDSSIGDGEFFVTVRFGSAESGAVKVSVGLADA